MTSHEFTSIPPVETIRSDGETVARSSRVQSVDRAVRLLEAIAEAAGEERSLADLAAATGLNRATAWRILTTLADHRLVAYSRDRNRWSLGDGLVGLTRPRDLDRLVADAKPVLARLAMQTGETAALAVLRGQSLVYVDEVAPSAIVAATWKGREVALHATSTGKVVLAFGAAAAAPSGPLQRFTDTTVTDTEVLAAELARVREVGYAVCCGEFDSAAWGVSAPILGTMGQLRAVLSVWGPAGRVREERFAALGALALEAAQSLSDP